RNEFRERFGGGAETFRVLFRREDGDADEIRAVDHAFAARDELLGARDRGEEFFLDIDEEETARVTRDEFGTAEVFVFGSGHVLMLVLQAGKDNRFTRRGVTNACGFAACGLNQASFCNLSGSEKVKNNFAMVVDRQKSFTM